MSNADEISGNGQGSVSMTPSDIYHRMGIRFPTLWPEKPALWFLQAESYFSLCNITSDEMKFNYILSELDCKYATEVEDIILTPPAQGKYEILKTELIKRLSALREKEVKQLLIQEEIGNRRPSQFLRDLQKIAGTDVPYNFLKSLWISRLPIDIQRVLQSQPTSDLSSLADLADAVMDAMSAALADLAKQIAALSRQVEHLCIQDRRSRSRTRSRAGNGHRHSSQRSRQRSSSRSTRSQSNYRKYPQCWYHAKFGKEARRCVNPCDFRH